MHKQNDAAKRITSTLAEFRNLSIEKPVEHAVIYLWESHNAELEDEIGKIQATVDLIFKKFRLSVCEKYEVRTGYLSRFNYISKPINSSSPEEVKTAVDKGKAIQIEWTEKHETLTQPLGFLEKNWEEYVTQSSIFNDCKEIIQDKLNSNKTFNEAFLKTVDDFAYKHGTDKENGYQYIIEETSWILSLPLLHLNKPIFLIHIGNDNTAIRTLFNQFPNLQGAVKWLSPHFSHKAFLNLSEFQLEYRSKTNFGYSYARIDVNSVKRITEYQSSKDITVEELLKTLNYERSEKELLLSIISRIPGHVYWLSRDNIYLGCNDLQASHFGLKSREDVIGKTNHDLLEKKEAFLLDQINTLVMETGKTHRVEEYANMKNGFCDYLSIKNPLFNREGKVVGMLGLSVDITDRRLAERLQKEKEVIEKVSMAVEAMSGNIAHEMRTPMAIVGINADNLKMAIRQLSIDQEQKINIQNMLKNIKFAIKRGSHVVDMLLAKLHNVFCKKDNMIDLTEFPVVSVKESVDETIKEYPFYSWQRKFISWNCDAIEDFYYRGDNIVIKQILNNLIKNALHAIEEAGHGQIFITSKKDTKFNYLFFKDTSLGISPKHIDTIFDPFVKYSKTGSGLGLAFCKMMMQTYGGDITCISEEGKYTEFTLHFPVTSETQISKQEEA